uniref:Monodehydroascorbate reductase n=1 Tax=Tanacetum cinerariifolium TaxID=118510 RepID=A0A6L2N1A8_TANCI|nr:hypothetical protein [Tanacetum cinerariifolium]
MDITIDQQVALDEALVPHASRLRIGKSNFRLRSDLKSKESTLQVVYDVLKLAPFYKAFLVTADVLEIYMQKFWATATVHHHSIRFKMNNKKRIVNLEYFREMLQICLRIPNQQFDELPFKEEILAFLKELGHITNKCLSGKSTGYDNLHLSQAQILWGMYHKKNVDFAYLLWEDFVYQVEHKDATKSNEMYYPRFTKVIVNFFMTKDQSIPRRNKVNWHFARDDHMFTTIKLVFRHQNTQQYGAILSVELTNEAIRNSEYNKEYYAIALGAEPPKTKASVRKKQSSSDTTMPPLTATCKRLKPLAKVGKPAKEKQPAKSSKAKGVLDVPTYESVDEEISWKSSEDDDDDEKTDSDNDGDDFVHPKFSTHVEEDKDEESFDLIVQTPSQVENTDDKDNDEDSHDVQTTHVIEDTHVTLTPVNPKDASVMTTAELPLLSVTTLPSPSIPIILHVQQTPTPSPANVPSSSLKDLPNFGSLFRFNHRLKTLETNFSEFMQTNQFAEAISSIPGIVDKYLDHRMNKAVKVAEQVKEQVKVQVSKILLKIENTVNEQLEAEVLTRSSNSSNDVAADLSVLKLKKILIDKMERNKSIHISDEQKNLYKALVDAY